MISGEEIASFNAEELCTLAATHGNAVRALKQHIQLLAGLPEYRQRLASQDGLLSNDQALTELQPSLDLQVLVLPYYKATRFQLKLLLRAAAEDRPGDLEELLQLPLDPDSGARDRTALGVAASHGSEACVRLLLNAGADKNKITDLFGASPLWSASNSGRQAVVRLLLQAGVDKDKAAITGTTPLWVASFHGHTGIVHLLLTAGADKNRAKDENKASPLYVACEQGHTEVAKLLLDANADTEKANENGETPLWISSQRSHLAILSLLLEAGANKDHANHLGTSPLWIASAYGHVEVVSRLIRAGADTRRPNLQATPFWIASRGGHFTVMRLLLAAALKHRVLLLLGCLVDSCCLGLCCPAKGLHVMCS